MKLTKLFCVTALVVGTTGIQAAQTTITKANTATMNTAVDWGGTAPAAGTIGQFDATISATNAAALTLGGNVTLDQLTFLGTLNTNVTIASGNTLTLGSVSSGSFYGIDMSAANRDVTINCTLAFGTNHTWNTAAGRTLTVGGTINGNGFNLTKSGTGTNSLTGGSAGTPSIISKLLPNAGVLNVSGYLNTTGNFSLNGGTVNWSGVGTNTGTYLGIGNGSGASSASALNLTGGILYNASDNQMWICKGNSNTITPVCTMTVSGGAFFMAANKNIYLGSGYNGDQAGTGILTVTNAGTFDTGSSTGLFQLGDNGGVGMVNLDGGTLSTLRSFTPGINPGNPGVSLFNFNGGTLAANGGNANFMSGLTAAYVRNGGAVIQDNGNAIAIAQSLLHTTNAADNATDGGLTKKGTGTLTLTGTNTYTGPTLVFKGVLEMDGRHTGTNTFTVANLGTLSGTGVISAPVVVNNGGTLAPGAGGLMLGNLTLNSGSTLALTLGATNGPANSKVVVNGNLTLDGTLLITDTGAMTSGGIYTAITYTGALVNNGLTNSGASSWMVSVDTSVTNLVRVIATQKIPVAQFTNGNLAVTSTSTNLGGVLNFATPGPIWYEVRDQTNKLWDFGATLARSPWSITVRHLRPSTNTVTIFARNSAGYIQSSSVQLTMTLGDNPPVRPRPIPAEIWWGGLSTNFPMTNYLQWPFVQKYQDGYFFHSAGWGGGSALTALKQSLATNLLPYNTKYWPELGGSVSGYGADPGGWAAQELSQWGGWAAGMEDDGIIWSEFTHDYRMNQIQNVCQANPTWPTNDQIALWTGDLSVASTNYPYTNGVWRDVFNGYYDRFPHVKVGHTSQPEYWPWDDYPALMNNQLSFTVTNPTTAFSFNAKDIVASFMNMAGDIGHPYFALASDAPWNYFGEFAYYSSYPNADPPLMRAKIRVYEKYLQSRGGRHTLICNVGNAGSQSGGDDAQDLYYETKSLNSLRLHQQEGGRANRYLFEGWYYGIPHAVVPETKPGSYTHLALSAIQFLKGIATNGAMEQLALGVPAVGVTTNTISFTNNGDTQCLPAITVTESGTSYLAARYFDAAGNDITAAILSAEGYTYTNLLSPGQSATLTAVVWALPGAVATSTRAFTFEAFWNPQDPTGVVRDRKSFSVIQSNLVALVQPSPTAWYKLEGNANDSSGNGYNGTPNSISYVAGVVDTNAAAFNGTSSYIQIPRSLSNDFTIAFWVKTTNAFGSGQWYNGKGLVDGEVAGTTNDFGVSLLGSNAAFGVGNPDTTITSSAIINDGQWHHVAATRVNSSGAMTLYVDGIYQTGTAGPTGTRNAPPFLRLGSIQTGSSSKILSGVLDDVRLYGSVLSGVQIAVLATLAPSNAAPTLAAIAGQSLIAGQTLTLTNRASDPDAPPQTLTFSLLSPPSGMTLNATNGMVSWRPAIAQSPSTNLISVAVTDNGSPPLGATQQFAVTVLRPDAPTLSSLTVSGGVFSLTVSGSVGPDYIVQASTNLTSWTNLLVTNSPPFTWADTNAGRLPQRFYRTQLGP